MIDEEADEEITLIVNCPDCGFETSEVGVPSTNLTERSCSIPQSWHSA